MAADDRAGAGAIDVDITGDEFGFDPLDVGRTAREESRGERVVGVVRDSDRFIEIAHFDDAQDRAENFFAREPRMSVSRR